MWISSYFSGTDQNIVICDELARNAPNTVALAGDIKEKVLGD